MILIGSRAFLDKIEQTPETLYRIEHSDYDVVMAYDDFLSWKEEYKDYIKNVAPRQFDKFVVLVEYNGKEMQYEIEVGMANNSAQFLLNNINEACEENNDYSGFFGEKYRCLKLVYSLATKHSHLKTPVCFKKSIEDYHAIRKVVLNDKQASLSKTILDYYDIRKQEAEGRVKEHEFINSTKEIFDRKDILNVLYGDFALMENVVQDIANYENVSERIVFSEMITHHQKIQYVQEKAYVIAIQNHVQYELALEEICTFPNYPEWLKDFVIQKYPELIEKHNPYYLYKFKLAVMHGEIKSMEER